MNEVEPTPRRGKSSCSYTFLMKRRGRGWKREGRGTWEEEAAIGWRNLNFLTLNPVWDIQKRRPQSYTRPWHHYTDSWNYQELKTFVTSERIELRGWDFGSRRIFTRATRTYENRKMTLPIHPPETLWRKHRKTEKVAKVKLGKALKK